MQSTGVGSEMSSLVDRRRKNLFAVAADVARVDPERIDRPGGGGDAGVATESSVVAEAGDARVLPQHARVLRGRGGAHRLRPLLAVAGGRAHQQTRVARGGAGA